MSRSAWLGVDLGTQGVRALAVDDDGRVRGSGRAPLTSCRDGDRHEQDPDQWVSAALAAVRDAVAALDGYAVEAVAVDATSGSIALVDAAGRPGTPGLMYDDGRAGAQLARVDEVGAEAWALGGYQRMQAGWALPKLLWLREHVEGADRLGLAHQADVVTRALVGHAVPTDTSTALKTGADAASVAWPVEVLGALGVPTEVLPDLVLPGTVLGGVGPTAAAATGLAVGTPVVAGMTDGCAAQLGAGVTRPGQWNSVLGTTLVLKGVTTARPADPSGAVYAHRSPTKDWLPGGASSVGAGAVAREYAGADLGRLTEAAAGRLPTPVVRYPLTGRGERFPFVAPGAAGFVDGTPRDGAEAFAALLQGVALVERLCLDSLDRLGADVVGPVVLTGGGARNPTWSQLRADVLGRPVALVENAEPALGMCVLAAAGARATDGAAPDVAAVATCMVRVRTRLEPDPQRTAAYAAPYRRLLDRLEAAGWLPAALAAHSLERSPQ